MSMDAERPSSFRDSPDRVRVGVAEFAVASGDTLLTTSGLGSCVGIAVADPTRNIAGLAHVMLPEAPKERADNGKPAKSAASGVEHVLDALKDAGGDSDSIEAKLAGGSQMFDFSGVSEAVGERNVEAARAALTDRDVSVVAQDVGGSHGRSLSLDPSTWTLSVTSANDGEVTL